LGRHETIAISLIKPNLKSHARNLISYKQTIAAIITQEVEKLTKALGGAYISEGLSQSLAITINTALQQL